MQMERERQGFERVGEILGRPGASTSSNPGQTTRREERTEKCTCDCGTAFSGKVILWDARVVWRSSECLECKAKREADEKTQAEEERAQGILALQNKWRQGCGIPPGLISRTFESFKREAQRVAFTEVAKWAAEFPVEDSRGYPSMMLYSERNVYGVGKTHLMVAAANRIIGKWNGNLEALCRVRFETGPGLVRRIRATYNLTEEQRPLHETEEDVYGSLRGVKLLIVDDIGKETPSNHTREVYFHIINERLNWGLPVLVSTNLNPNSPAFAEVVGGATVSRLMGMIRGKGYQLSGQDWRKQEKQA